MNADMIAAYPLRLRRGTTGTVHAGKEIQVEIRNFNAPTVAERSTGKFKTITIKACGSDANTLRVTSGTSRSEAEAEVTCKSCLKRLS
jgi:hypothetical protein